VLGGDRPWGLFPSFFWLKAVNLLPCEFFIFFNLNNI
jgi:hypothetical protein